MDIEFLRKSRFSIYHVTRALTEQEMDAEVAFLVACWLKGKDVPHVSPYQVLARIKSVRYYPPISRMEARTIYNEWQIQT